MVTKKQAVEGYAWHENGCTRTVGSRGGVTVRQVYWRRNGATKTWKTRPDAFRIPIKHGFKTCAYLTDENAEYFHAIDDCPLAAENG